MLINQVLARAVNVSTGSWLVETKEEFADNQGKNKNIFSPGKFYANAYYFSGFFFKWKTKKKRYHFHRNIPKRSQESHKKQFLQNLMGRNGTN